MYNCFSIRTVMTCLGFILGTITSAQAQLTGYSPIKDIEGFKKKFSIESQKILSITSDFTQEKTLTALTEKITSTGKFWFKRSNRVRLEYTKPFTYLVVMNGDKILVKDNQKENRINTRSSKVFQQVNRIMIDCVQGTILENKDFNTRVFENETSFILEMTPVSKSLGEFFKTIILTVEKKDFSARSILMNEPMGDTTLITFERKKLNEQIPDAIFAP